jgi:hypothetical protein
MASLTITLAQPPTVDETVRLYEITPEEEQVLAQFLVEYPTHTSILPGKVLRFIRARKQNLKLANEMLATHLKWIERVQPDQVLEADVDKRAMDSGCWRYFGLTDDGSPVAWVQVGFWNPHEYDNDAYEMYVAFFTSMMERQMTDNTRHVVVFDLSGWAFWHGSYLGYVKTLVDIAQNQYPERLRRVVLVNAPFLFRASWVVIRPWLDPVTVAKVVFVAGVEAIQEEFAKLSVPNKIVPSVYGGEIDENSMQVPGFPTRGDAGEEKEDEEEDDDDEDERLTF